MGNSQSTDAKSLDTRDESERAEFSFMGLRLAVDDGEEKGPCCAFRKGKREPAMIVSRKPGDPTDFRTVVLPSGFETAFAKEGTSDPNADPIVKARAKLEQAQVVLKGLSSTHSSSHPSGNASGESSASTSPTGTLRLVKNSVPRVLRSASPLKSAPPPPSGTPLRGSPRPLPSATSAPSSGGTTPTSLMSAQWLGVDVPGLGLTVSNHKPSTVVRLLDPVDANGARQGSETYNNISIRVGDRILGVEDQSVEGGVRDLLGALSSHEGKENIALAMSSLTTHEPYNVTLGCKESLKTNRWLSVAECEVIAQRVALDADGGRSVKHQDTLPHLVGRLPLGFVPRTTLTSL
eukprot:CAMPEP_0181313642 /NCGR_PEP_ID=MMETSP1101-20121128/14362_1 /TAXON_ID=46948 /ORGANISM="Rhodomonas abbreviata, Strain Caron Lab Isolate" /LENGTH=348 /DNA_ID=CAMNT_0023420619 /DNA_START=92 /DNA_END=1139 /DNA_ORIENTATION=+